jgi:ABC-type branched-subunit amino acid transport system permease subunit/ABC-type branched-subunit amino acid transport system ATPase component
MMDFFTFAFLGLGTGSICALLAMGLVLIYRGSGVINFAHGAFALLGAYTVFELRTEAELPFYVALVVAMAVVAVVGIGVHFLVMRPLRTASPLARVIATLGVLTILTQVVLLRYGAEQRTVDVPVSTDSISLTDDLLVGRQNLYLLLVAIVCAVVLALISNRTRVGRALSASAENPRAAAALGWSPDLLACFTWGLAGALAAVAGAFFPVTSSGFISVTQMSALIIGALATALLAEFRSYALAVVGGLLIGMGQALATRYIDQTGVADAVPFIVIILVLVVRGRGLPVRGMITDRLPRVGTGRIRPIPALITSVVALVLLRFAVPDGWQSAIIVSITFAIVGLSVVVITGYAGQLSLAQFALGGVGAYAAGRLAAAQGWPMEPALLAGVLVAMIVGFVIGLPALRTRGVNLAVITFGLGFVIYQLVFSNSDYTGKDAQTKIDSLTFLGLDVDPITHPGNYSTLCLVALVVVALIVANLRRSRVGRRLLAVRTNERAAAAVGVNVFQTKLYAFTLSAGIAGLGGALYGFSYPTILYQQLFPSDMSINVLVLTVIGGAGYVLGPVIGATLATGGIGVLFFGDATTSADSNFVKYLPLITGFLLLFTLIGSQNGIVDRAQTLLAVMWQRLPIVHPRTTSPDTAPANTTAKAKVEPHVLDIIGVTQRFGGFTALSEVSMTVRPGEVVGLLGPNGAGKTTLIDAVTGYNRITAGSVRWDGDDMTSWSPHRRARAGLSRSFQSLELFDDLTVRENLLAASDSRDLLGYATNLVYPGPSNPTDTVLAAIAELGLTDVLDVRAEELSYGRRRLVAIARAVATRPSVLLLDEPAAGLDEEESSEVGHLIRRLADDWGIGVLLIEHDVPMVLRTADRVHVLDFGRTIAEGTSAAIRDDTAVRAAYLGEPAAATESGSHVP